MRRYGRDRGSPGRHNTCQAEVLARIGAQCKKVSMTEEVAWVDWLAT